MSFFLAVVWSALSFSFRFFLLLQKKFLNFPMIWFRFIFVFLFGRYEFQLARPSSDLESWIDFDVILRRILECLWPTKTTTERWLFKSVSIKCWPGKPFQIRMEANRWGEQVIFFSLLSYFSGFFWNDTVVIIGWRWMQSTAAAAHRGEEMLYKWG